MTPAHPFRLRHYFFPLELSEGVELERPQIDLEGEDALLELAGAIESAGVQSAAPADQSYGEDLTPEQAALNTLEQLVGRQNVNTLTDILAAYTAQKRFFSGLITRSDVKHIKKIGKQASALVKQINIVETLPWSFLLEMDEDQIDTLASALRKLKKLTKIDVKLEKDLPDLEAILQADLTDWWIEVTGSGLKFWSRDAETHSQFVRYMKIALGFLPRDVRPNDSRGTAGFSRIALKRRYEKYKKQQALLDKFFSLMNENISNDLEKSK